MSGKITAREIEGKSFKDILDLFGLDPDHAEDSEYGGDSDAGDGFPIRAPSSEKRAKRVRRSESASSSSDSTTDSSSAPSSGSGNSFPESEEEDEPEPQVLPRIPIPDLLPSSSSSSEDSDVGGEEPKWKKGEGKGRKFEEKFKKTEFLQNFGPKVPIDTNNILNIFFIFFNETFLNTIIEQSNLYASQKGVNLNFQLEELKCFLGILILMGFHQLPSIRLYWSNNKNFAVPRISKVISLRRFLTLLRYLHLNNNSIMPLRGSPDFDKLYKIRPLLTHFSQVFGSVFSPSRFLAIDESMIAFKGRSSLKQYMPLKPIKRGFKIWAICCSVTGFLLGFDFYTGKDEARTTSLGEKVVLDLSRAFESLGYCIFFDRFFSSFPLVKKLLANGLFACGTILQKKKYFPSSLLSPDKGLKYGDRDFCSCSDFGLVKWKDRGTKCVCVVSSIDDPEQTTPVGRKNKKGEKVTVNCPTSIARYNQYMGGVDLFDQYMSYYTTQWKSRRWWMKAFYYFIDAAVVNSYILYKEEIKNLNSDLPHKNKITPLSHLMFRSNLADELISDFCSRKTPTRTVLVPKKNFTSRPSRTVSPPKGHLPEKSKQRRCAFCSTKKGRKRTSIKCSTCDVGLCLTPCFKDFHDSMI